MSDWWKRSAVYQIYPKSFCCSGTGETGDINGIISKLDYIKDLGVDVIWLSPICCSPGKDCGYDISDYRNIDPMYGTMEDYERLISETHLRGMKIIADVVTNHTSDEHSWFKESKMSRTNPKSDYYFWRDGKNGNPPNNWGAIFGGPAWNYCKEREQYYLALFSPFQPDLNWDNPTVRNEIYDMMRFWLDKGVDGFRIDAIGYISKPETFEDGIPGENGFASCAPCVNGRNIHRYIKELRQKALKGYDTLTVGENALTPIEETIKYANSDGSEFNMMIVFEHVDLGQNEHGKWNDNKIDLIELKKLFNDRQNKTFGKAWNALYWNNHDQPRSVSRLGSEKPEYRELSAKAVATNMFFMCGTPFIYQGEEIGMTNMNFTSFSQLRDLEETNAYNQFVYSGEISVQNMLKYISLKGRDNARTPMQWSADENAGFGSGKPWIDVNPNYTEINVAEQLGRDDSVLSYYKKLISLHRSLDIVENGDFELIAPENPDVFAYRRKNESEILTVVCNFTEKTLSFDAEDGISLKCGKILISDYENTDFKALRPYEAYAVLTERKTAE